MADKTLRGDGWELDRLRRILLRVSKHHDHLLGCSADPDIPEPARGEYAERAEELYEAMSGVGWGTPQQQREDGRGELSEALEDKSRG